MLTSTLCYKSSVIDHLSLLTLSQRALNALIYFLIIQSLMKFCLLISLISKSAYELHLLLLLMHQTYYLSQHILIIHRTFTCFRCVKYAKSSVTNTNNSAILSVDTDSAQGDQTTTTVPHWSYLKTIFTISLFYFLNTF